MILRLLLSSTFVSLYLYTKQLLYYEIQLFASGMDALLALQGEWRASSVGLRERLAEQLCDAIYPRYTDFFDTYSEVGFSRKHMSEYLRYIPKDVERSLRSFFG